MQTDYYNRSEISHSDLMLIDKSIEHYLRKGKFDSTDAMDIGRAFHCYILEREKFDSEFVVKPDGLALNTIEGMLWKEFNLIERYGNRDLINLVIANRERPSEFNAKYIAKPNDIKLNTAEGKKWKSEYENSIIISEKDMEIVKSFELREDVLAIYWGNIKNKEIQYINADRTIIDFKDYQWFELMQKKIIEHPMNYVLQGNNIEVEKEIFFEYQDLQCRSKLDYINPTKRIIIDFKTISDCSKAESESKWKYSSQAFFYQIACHQQYGELFDCIFIFAEKSYPHGIKYIKFTPETLTIGANKIQNAIDKYKNYLENPNIYTGYSETLIEV